MTHGEIVKLIKTGGDSGTLVMEVERGDHVVPNIRECFPVKTEQELEQVYVEIFLLFKIITL